MLLSPFKFRLFLLTKLPIAWLAGLRLLHLTDKECQISVILSWLNKNPFQSMFWAVQGMAAELSTGVLTLEKISFSQKNISMLVIEQKACFLKKAKGKIIFTCIQGDEIDAVIAKAIQTGEGKTLWVQSIGKDQMNETVAEFSFHWSLKVKSSK